ncbi:MAG TPA: acetoacetate decarboxylase family protein, partial [Bacillota bacterium]|nr:acetoacetate decarboxylase family protein [Bacillota bacterium]
MANVRHDKYTVPIHSPLYSRPPWYSLGTMVQMVYYETKREVIEALLPKPLQYCSNEVIAWVSSAPFTTHGPLNEAAIFITCKFEGVQGVYEPFVYCDQETALVSGREVIGWAKKPGRICLEMDGEVVRGDLRRGCTRLMSLACTVDCQ